MLSLFLDALHAYFGVCGLSLIEEPGLNTINAALNMSQPSVDHLSDIHRGWHSSALPAEPELYRDKHIQYLRQILKELPGEHPAADTSR